MHDVHFNSFSLCCIASNSMFSAAHFRLRLPKHSLASRHRHTKESTCEHSRLIALAKRNICIRLSLLVLSSTILLHHSEAEIRGYYEVLSFNTYACVCVRMRTHVYVYVRVRAYACVCVHMRAYACVYVRMRAYACVCVRMRTYACVCVRMRTHACICVRMRAYGAYACVCVRMRAHTCVCVHMRAYA